MALELNRWATMALNHWKEHQPKRYRRLMKAGTLAQEAAAAARLTAEAVDGLVTEGATREEAFQAVRERYLFPPAESGVWEEAPVSIGQEAMTEFIRTLQEGNED